MKKLTVISAFPVTGTTLIAANKYGTSLWGRTAKLVCLLPDGERRNSFLKMS